MMKYRLALQLHDLYNTKKMSNYWLELFFNQKFNGRNNKANFYDTSKYKVGKNLITHRLYILNSLIDFDWLNLSKDGFKIKCKSLFLK